MTGLEPAHLSVLEPKSNVSANFTTSAYSIITADRSFTALVQTTHIIYQV